MTPNVSDNDIVTEFNQFYYDAYRTWGVFYSEAYRDLRAYAGDNWLEQEKRMLEQQKRMVLELNKIRRVVNLFSGYERENRYSTIVSPIENADQMTADQMTNLMLYIYDKANAHHVFSEAFDHSLKTGLSLIHVYLDYSQDQVNGDIKFAWKPFNAMMLDPYFSKRDFSDCDRCSIRDLLSREQVKSLLPFIDPKIIDQLPTGIRDNKYTYLGLYRQFNSSYIAKNLLTYDQYWVKRHVPQKWIVNVETGEQSQFNGTEEEAKQLEEMLALNPNLQLYNTYKQTVVLNIIVAGKLLYSGPDPTGLDEFPFLPLLTYFEPLIDSYELKIQGVVRSMRDAQRQYNRRHSQIIDLMESVVNTGWISKNGAVLDPDMLFMSGAGRNIVINEDFDMGDLREINPPQIPPGYLSYQDIMDKNILEIPGWTDEIMGLRSEGDSQVSGNLAQIRASNGLKGVRSVYDNYECVLKGIGNLVMKTAQINYTPGKVQRIINEEPTEEFFSGAFGKYDATIKQAVLTQTQREAYYYQLVQLRSLGVAIPDDSLLEAAPLIDKSKLVERLQQQQQAAEQAQQKVAEAEQMEMALKNSQREENIALAQERRARVVSDIALARERISQADVNNAKAILDSAKVVSEMEDADRRRIMELLRLAVDLQSQQSMVNESQLNSDMSKVAQLSEGQNAPSLQQEGIPIQGEPYG